MGCCISVHTCACVCACVFNDDGGADIITSMLMVFFSIAPWPHSIHRLYLLALINRTTTLDIDANMGCKIKQNYVRMLLNSLAFLFSDCMQMKKILTRSISTPLQLLDSLYIIILIYTKKCLLTNPCYTVFVHNKGKKYTAT